jgi:hypothetical protein
MNSKASIKNQCNSYNTATPFIADREPATSYAGGTSPLTLSCPDTNLSYNELELIIASFKRGCLNDAIVDDDRIELVSPADASESDERLEMTAASTVRFGIREARHGQLGINEIELSKTSEYCGREVQSGLHRHCIQLNKQKKV